MQRLILKFDRFGSKNGTSNMRTKHDFNVYAIASDPVKKSFWALQNLQNGDMPRNSAPEITTSQFLMRRQRDWRCGTNSFRSIGLGRSE